MRSLMQTVEIRVFHMLLVRLKPHCQCTDTCIKIQVSSSSSAHAVMRNANRTPHLNVLLNQVICLKKLLTPQRNYKEEYIYVTQAI
jgi:hypothetical protein